MTLSKGAQHIHKQKLWRDYPDLGQEQLDDLYKQAIKEVDILSFKNVGEMFRKLVNCQEEKTI